AFPSPGSPAGLAPPLDQALHTTHQRQSRTLHPDQPARVGVRTQLRKLRATRGSPAAVASSLQLAQTSRQPWLQPADQPCATSTEQRTGFTHLVGKLSPTIPPLRDAIGSALPALLPTLPSKGR